MARAPQQRITDISIIYKGEEPKGLIIDSSSSNYNINLLRALNWYSIDKTKNDAHKYIKEYVKKNLPSELKTFEKVEEKAIIPTYGWIARLINTGAKLSEKDLNKFNGYLIGIINQVDSKIKAAALAVKPVQAKPTIQLSIKEKAAEYIGELEGKLDSFIKENKEFNLYDEMKAAELPQVYVPFIVEWLNKKHAEFSFLSETTDKELLEAYSNLGKRQIKSIAKLLSAFKEDCDKYQQYKKANRKPRIRKEKPAGVQVKNLKFKLKDDELGLKSVSVVDIVGATQVWLFNTKTKKLICYKTEDTKGISVKGSSLQNYDPDLSTQKTLRKPKDTIDELMSAGKVQLRKFMDSIKTKSAAVNGRINADTIILKTIK